MMKNVFTWVMLAAALVFADQSSVRPESSVPTPAEKSDVSKETPDFSANDNAEWQKMREERREARRQILMELRNSTAAEKQSIRQNVTEPRNERARIEGEINKNMQPRERTPQNEWKNSHGPVPPPPWSWQNPNQDPNAGWNHPEH